MRKTFWFTLLFLLALTSLAFASDTPAFDIASGGIDLLFYALGLVATGLVALAAKRFADKFKVQIPQAWLVTINSYIDQAINFAEEWARKQVKAGAAKLDGNSKMNAALGFLLRTVDDKKLKAMAEDQIKQLIEARLSQMRKFDPKTDIVAVHGVVEDEFGKKIVVMSNGTTKALTVLLVAFMLVSFTGCSWFKKESREVGKNAVSCVKDNHKQLTSQFGPLLEGFVLSHLDPSTGKVDKEPVKAAMKSFTKDVGLCVAADVFARLMKKGTEIASGVQSSELPIDGDSLREVFHELSGGVTYETANGSI